MPPTEAPKAIGQEFGSGHGPAFPKDATVPNENGAGWEEPLLKGPSPCGQVCALHVIPVDRVTFEFSDCRVRTCGNSCVEATAEVFWFRKHALVDIGRR